MVTESEFHSCLHEGFIAEFFKYDLSLFVKFIKQCKNKKLKKSLFLTPKQLDVMCLKTGVKLETIREGNSKFYQYKGMIKTEKQIYTFDENELI
jgi:hypothetical protein